MLSALRERYRHLLFDRCARRILRTAPVGSGNGNTLAISSVSHSDLRMYLIAFKTFQKYVPGVKAAILDDGSLTDEDRTLLREHVSPREIVRLDDVPFRTGRKGVRWGIMLAIADRVPDSYVVQLDSDTVTTDALPEVADAIARNQAFTLTSEPEFKVAPISEICERMKGDNSTHVQKVAEANFDKLRSYASLKYVRGNSGLAGFPKRAFTRQDVEDFYDEMLAILGDKIRERGSFQVSSNFWVANSPGAHVLPFERYTTIHPRHDLSQTKFFHFIGRYRYVDRRYETECDKQIRSL